MVKGSNILKEIETYKGVIFDLDGTLIKLNIDREKLKEKLKKHIEKHFSEKMEFTPLDKAIQQCKKKYGNKTFIELLKIVETFENKKAFRKINPSLCKFIDSNTNHKIALYTMNTKKTVENFCKKTFKKNNKVFSIIIHKNNCIKPKPAKEDLLKIVKKRGFKKKEIIYIGDSNNDFESGKKANIKTLII